MYGSFILPDPDIIIVSDLTLKTGRRAKPPVVLPSYKQPTKITPTTTEGVIEIGERIKY